MYCQVHESVRFFEAGLRARLDAKNESRSDRCVGNCFPNEPIGILLCIKSVYHFLLLLPLLRDGHIWEKSYQLQYWVHIVRNPLVLQKYTRINK